MTATYDPLSQVYAETRALVAVMSGDTDAAEKIIDEMTRFERAEFAEALDRLEHLLGTTCEKCGKRVTDPRELVTRRPLSPNREYLCRQCAGYERSRARGL